MSRSTKLFQRFRNSFHQWFTLMLFTDNHLTQKALVLVCFMEMLYMKKTIFESFTGLICSDLLLSKFDRLVKHILFSLSKIYMAMHIIQSLSLLWASRLVYTAKSKLQECMFSDGKEIFRMYLTLGRHLKRQITKSIVKGERLNEAGVGGVGGGLQPLPPFNFQRRLLIYLDIF